VRLRDGLLHTGPRNKKRFRGTAAHNTLMIDGIEQNRINSGPLGLFILGNEAAVSPSEQYPAIAARAAISWSSPAYRRNSRLIFQG